MSEYDASSTSLCHIAKNKPRNSKCRQTKLRHNVLGDIISKGNFA